MLVLRVLSCGSQIFDLNFNVWVNNLNFKEGTDFIQKLKFWFSIPLYACRWSGRFIFSWCVTVQRYVVRVRMLRQPTRRWCWCYEWWYIIFHNSNFCLLFLFVYYFISSLFSQTLCKLEIILTRNILRTIAQTTKWYFLI